MKPKTIVTLLTLALSASLFRAQAAQPPSASSPLTRTHAHNDYEHARPLLDALDQGFCSVEADIYLVEGKLLVAHDRNKVSPERTLEALYLEPLRERIQNNGGRVYRGGPPVTLLIDVKSEADSTYAVLRQVLQKYAAILTSFSDSGTETRAITAIISGNRSREMLAAEKTRLAALDGRPEDLDPSVSKNLVPLVSEDWKRLFQWRGSGPIPESEGRHLRDLTDKAHQQGRRIRFWGTPDRPEMWRELFVAGVDLINTDDLAGLRKFLVNDADKK